ncbi:helix-turn-helix transcriptional regulator [Propionibacterium acidifaciens]|uniref:response regulator transcription factor n=1 Tax=Propionibacterium acidifaciens TaxID=556499 RepID=UPI0028DB1F4C|nr:helix-turn-helix transcriptional regulator [Propionibacterium acidifaciens]
MSRVLNKLPESSSPPRPRHCALTRPATSSPTSASNRSPLRTWRRAGRRTRGSPGGAGAVRLTPRQVDVLRGLAEGKTLGRIATDLGLGKETIRSTAKQMYKRLGVHDRASAVLMGQALGMI